MQIRRYKIGEEDALRKLCRDTTLRVNLEEYGGELVEKWAAKLKDVSKWKERIRRHNPFVAEIDGIIVGFAEITETGKISAFYSHCEWQRKGVGDALYKAIEAEATQLEIDCIQVDSSSGASGFFERKGFRIIEEREILTDGIPSRSFLMHKLIN